MTEHELVTEGPLAYPGGKDGWYRVHCICSKDLKYWWGATEAQALKPAREHRKAKLAQQRATEGQEAAPERTADEFREGILEWLEGRFAYVERNDLAAILHAQPGHFVTLTYRELWSIVETVRFNSKQR